MMTFEELLRDNQDAIVARWVDAALAAYPQAASAAFKAPKDPFSNPVGHSLRAGTRTSFGMLMAGTDVAEIPECLETIIKIRAVQQLSASQAVGFLFHLKDAVRAELGEAVGEPPFARELAQLERRIDRLALAAFDRFVQCREQVCALRVNEVKRQVSWLMNRMNERGSDPPSARIGPDPGRLSP